MNYKKLSTELYNSGGNCMIGITTVYDIAGNRTLYVLTDGDNAEISTVDYHSNDNIERDDTMVVDYVYYEQLEPTNENFNLFVDALFEYIRAMNAYCNYTKRLPIYMFSAEQRNAESREYMEWHIENIGDEFETDGTHIIREYEYNVFAYNAAQEQTYNMPAEVYNSIVNFSAAFERMNLAFSDPNYMSWLSSKYPFSYSFDELTLDVVEWCADMLKNQIAE